MFSFIKTTIPTTTTKTTTKCDAYNTVICDNETSSNTSYICWSKALLVRRISCPRKNFSSETGKHMNIITLNIG